MRKGATLVAVAGLCLATAEGAQAVPSISDAALTAPAIVGQEAALAVRAVDPQAAVNGFAFAFENGEWYAGTACRLTDARGRGPGKPFRAGDAVSVTARVRYAQAGPSVARVFAFTGGCGATAEAVEQPLTVTATQPGDPLVPLITDLPSKLLPVLELPILGPVLGRTAQSSCAGAGIVPVLGGEALARRATLCLVNQMRARNGRRLVHSDKRLKRAAGRHARRMVRDGWFAHVGPDGVDLLGRVKFVRWIRAGHSWLLGENIGVGVDDTATPRGMVRSWMESTAHRANLLDPKFDRLGLAVVPGGPGTTGAAATYTAIFGRIDS